MVRDINQIVYQLFQKESLEQVSENELRYYVRQYPYAGAGHLLLAKKLQLAGEKRAFEREVTVTSVYFTNPAWLQFLLRPDQPAEIPDELPNHKAVIFESPVDEEVIHPTDQTKAFVSDTIEEPGEHDFVMSPPEDSEKQHATDLNEGGHAEFTGSEELPGEEDVLAIKAEETIPDLPVAETKTEIEAEAEIEQPLEDAFFENIQEPEVVISAEEPVTEKPVPEKTKEEPSFAPIIPGLKEQADASSSNQLQIDPYHTVDYFASQGIKLRLDEYSKDKLGQQLKSFTDWIRSMKRLPQDPEETMNEVEQHSIRRIADVSVEEKEILTESMAEVWVKQGNYEKARQIYRKLSLQNPSKSSYFAAKIEQLKVL
ncbi:MAG: hypothetical protein ABW174_08275 [Flavitalea sp.]